MTKSEIIEHLHTLVSHNVIGDKQLMSRYKGFKTELECESFLKEKYADRVQLRGGQIISRSKSSESSLDDAFYFTVIPESGNLEDYIPIYTTLKTNFEQMFLVKYSDSRWKKEVVMTFPEKAIELPVPEFEIFKYDQTLDIFESMDSDLTIISNLLTTIVPRKKNSYAIKTSSLKWLLSELSKFDLKEITEIYFTRLIFDGFIGFSKVKGKMSDIDLILKKDQNRFTFIEIKEKDLPKRAKKGFGLDSPRIMDYIRLSALSGIPYALIVKHINNQKERRLINWKAIGIDSFVKAVEGEKEVLGGTGMRSVNSENYTRICPIDLFSVL